MKYIISNLRKIPLWRIITAGILLFGLSLNAYSVYSYSEVTVQEMIITAVGNTFGLYFIFMLLIADIGFDYQTSRILSKRPRFFGRNLGLVCFLCFLFTLCLIVCSFLALLLKSGSVTVSEELINVQLYQMEWIPASAAMALSILLFYLYFVFIASVVFTINSRCEKRPWGYLGVLAVSALDVTVYSLFDFPAGFFPSEYATVESAMLVTPDITLNIVISILYWLLLIAAAGVVYNIANKHDRKGDDVYETHYCG